MRGSEFLTWDAYFMGVAMLSADRSKDPHTKVGACIVGQDNKILSMGYNGMPRGCSDEVFPWKRDDSEELNNKYPYVCHAELNAILNFEGISLKGAKIYTTLFPCNECTKALIQTGIREVVYLSDKYRGTLSNLAAKRMMEATGIKYRKYEPEGRKIELEL